MRLLCDWRLMSLVGLAARKWTPKSPSPAEVCHHAVPTLGSPEGQRKAYPELASRACSLLGVGGSLPVDRCCAVLGCGSARAKGQRQG